MGKRGLYFFSFFLFAGFSAQAISVSGGVSGTWTLADSPVVVTADITVPLAMSLTIEPGVEVRFTTGTAFTILGALSAVGTAPDPIIFRSDEASPAIGDWAGMRFNNVAPGNQLVWCEIRHATTGVRVLGEDASSTVSFSFCTITECDRGFYFIAFDGGFLSNCTVSDCIVTANSGTGMYLEAESGFGGASSVSPAITRTSITANGLTGISCDAVGGFFCPRTSNVSPQIRECVIADNGGAGLACFGQGDSCPSLDNRGFAEPTITHTIIAGNGGDGIFASGETFNGGGFPTVEHCVIWDNAQTGVETGDDPTENTIVRNSIIGLNDIGIETTVAVAAYPLVEHNTFWQNATADFSGFAPAFGDMTGFTRMRDPADVFENHNADPLFVDAANGNFHLMPLSPGIDTGAEASPFVNEPEDNGDNANRGRYGNTAEATVRADSEPDGLPDRWEQNALGTLAEIGTDDGDVDFLNNAEEFAARTDPMQSDTDNDGIPDGDELFDDGSHGDTDGYITDPLNPDTDGDGIEDGEEVIPGADGFITDPTNPDTDGDYIPDGWEVDNGLNPTSNEDGSLDLDFDQLLNYEEFLFDTEIDNPDSPPSIYVNINGAIGGLGTEDDPFTSIQEAIDSIPEGEYRAVRVAPGAYTENIEFSTDRAGLALLGDPNGGTELVGGSITAQQIYFGNGLFTLPDAFKLGHFTLSDSGHGVNITKDGGINQVRFIRFFQASIANCTFVNRNNAVILDGKNCAFYIVNNTFEANSYGIHAMDFDDVLTQGNLFSNNTTWGARLWHGGPLSSSRDTYIGNAGGASFLTTLLFENGLLLDNGVGLDLANGSGVISNVTVVGNDLGIDLGIFLADDILANSVFWNNGNDITITHPMNDFRYSCIEDNDNGPGVIHLNPRFIDPANGDYRLRPDSPCIDRADGNVLPPFDFFGQPRFDAPAPNLGIGPVDYGDLGFHEMRDTDGDGMTDDWEIDTFGDLSRDGTGDDDGDNKIDLAEFRSATDPTVPDVFALAIGETTGAPGDAVNVSIAVDNAPTPASNLSFDLLFDPSQLSFVNASLAGLIAPWETLSVTQPTLGTVRINASTANMANAISAGATGNLFTLAFSIQPGASTQSTSWIDFDRRIGDTADWVACSGHVAIACCRDGDVSQDCAITPGDALLAFQGFLQQIQLTACQAYHADVDSAQNPPIVTPGDALCIFQRFLQLPSCIDAFPSLCTCSAP